MRAGPNAGHPVQSPTAELGKSAPHGFFLNDREVAALALKPVGVDPETATPRLGENPLLRLGLALAGADVLRSGEHDDRIRIVAEAHAVRCRGNATGGALGLRHRGGAGTTTG